jgi:hypothetical protein
VEPDWNALEDLLRAARYAYYEGDDVKFCAIVYMLKLMVEDLKDASRPIKGGIVHPAGTAEVQAEVI